MPSPFTHIRRHSASAIASISSTITSFCLPARSSSSSARVFSASSLKPSVASASKAIARSPAPMKVVKRQLRTLSARTYSYSGLFVTSFFLASFLPFQLAPTGRKVGGSKSRGNRKQTGREAADPDRHDMDSKSMASDPAAKNKQHRVSSTQSRPQIHANHRSGSSLQSSNHGASYRPRRTGTTTLGGAGRSGTKERGAAGRASTKKQKSDRMTLRRQGWR